MKVAVRDLYPLPAAGRAHDGVADLRGAIAVLEGRSVRGHVRVLADGAQQVMDLVNKGMLPADDVAVGPPVRDERMVPLRDVHAVEPPRLLGLLVHPVDLELVDQEAAGVRALAVPDGYVFVEETYVGRLGFRIGILGEVEELCDDILILNRGRQAARGDLHTLKLLSQGVYDVAVTFDRLPPGIEAELAARHPIRLSITHNTVEMTLKEDDGGILAVVSALAGRGRVLRLEVGGASLEDIFVELTKDRPDLAVAAADRVGGPS